VDREEWKAVALVIGTQIGAGVLGLPYAIKGLGFFWGSVAILTGSLLMLLTALFLLEALYQTNPNYHLFDLVEHHFGRPGAIFFWLTLLLAGYGALTAYLDGMSQSLNQLLGLPLLPTGILLWSVLSYVIVRGLRFSSAVEAAAVFLLLLLFGVVVLWALPLVKPYHVPLSPENLKLFFSAVVVSIFAFFAHLVIPEVLKLVRSRERAARVIYNAFAITTAVYVLFSLAVIGVLGENTPEISVFGLVDVFGEYFAPIAYLIPLFTMLTSYVGVGLGLRDMTREFLRKELYTFFAVLVPPALLFLLGVGFFLAVYLGSLALTLAGGIVPSLLAIKLRRKGIIPYRRLVGELSLLFFLLVLLWSLLPL